LKEKFSIPNDSKLNGSFSLNNNNTPPRRKSGFFFKKSEESAQVLENVQFNNDSNEHIE